MPVREDERHIYLPERRRSLNFDPAEHLFEASMELNAFMASGKRYSKYIVPLMERDMILMDAFVNGSG